MTEHRPDAAATPRRLGAGMIALAWVLLLGLLTILFSGWLEARWNPNREVEGRTGAGGVREVVLEQNRDGHYVADGAINGVPVTFLIDTGATTVSVPAGLAARLALERGARDAAQTANGVIVTWRTRLGRVRLGNIALHGVRAHINPGMGGDEVLLGMSFLRRLELIQRDGTLTLRQYPPGAAARNGPPREAPS